MEDEVLNVEVAEQPCDCNTVLECGCEDHLVKDCECPVVNARWGEVGHEIPGKFYQVYYGGRVLFDDEGIYDSFRANSEEVSTIVVKSVVTEGDAVEYPNYAWNKYGKAAAMEEVEVTVTVNETLATANPLAVVVIDGKYFDLAALKNPIKFVMNKDHKISIEWTTDLVESFRIIKVK